MTLKPQVSLAMISRQAKREKQQGRVLSLMKLGKKKDQRNHPVPALDANSNTTILCPILKNKKTSKSRI